MAMKTRLSISLLRDSFSSAVCHPMVASSRHFRSGWDSLPCGGSLSRAVPRDVLATYLPTDISWSHDGSWFAYAKGNQLLLAGSDGTSSRVLATMSEASAEIGHVRWSPNDQKIRFTLNSAGPGGSVREPVKPTLWEVAFDGSGLQELRFNWPGKPMECCGDWTVDGRYFVFKSEREGASKLWVLQEKSIGGAGSTAIPYD